VVLKLSGIYLFTEVMLEPLKADDTSIIAPGFTLALGGTLMTFLIRPGKREAPVKPENENVGHELFRRPLRTIRYSHASTEARGDGSRGSENASRTDVSGTQGRNKAGT
jgi:hypothetical protein